VNDLKVINAQQAYDLLEEVVKGREDFVYYRPRDYGNTCVYFDNNQPSCIVGHVLAELGLTAADVETFNAEAFLTILGRLEQHGFRFTEKASDVLFAAQYTQDGAGAPDDADHSWGEALNKAAERLRFSSESDK
jgi:hypothetical protein